MAMNKPHYTAADIRDQNTMFRLWQDRGAQTEKQLLAAGISLASQAKNVPVVAERVRAADLIAA
jgi:hypothetical protein